MTEEQRAHYAKFNEYGLVTTVKMMIELLQELPPETEVFHENSFLRVAVVNEKPILVINDDY